MTAARRDRPGASCSSRVGSNRDTHLDGAPPTQPLPHVVCSHGPRRRRFGPILADSVVSARRLEEGVGSRERAEPPAFLGRRSRSVCYLSVLPPCPCVSAPTHGVQRRDGPRRGGDRMSLLALAQEVDDGEAAWGGGRGTWEPTPPVVLCEPTTALEANTRWRRSEENAAHLSGGENRSAPARGREVPAAAPPAPVPPPPTPSRPHPPLRSPRTARTDTQTQAAA